MTHAHIRNIRLELPPVLTRDLLPLLVDRLLPPMREVSGDPDDILREVAERHILAASAAGHSEVGIRYTKRIDA